MSLTGTSPGNEPGQNDVRRLLSCALGLVTVAAALSGAVALIDDVTKNIGHDLRQVYEWVGSGPKPLVGLREHTSPKAIGELSNDGLCSDRLSEYENTYPNDEVILQGDPDRHVETVSLLRAGRLTYQYHCAYTSPAK